MSKSASSASAGRAARVGQALDEDRARNGNDRNRNQAAKLPPSHKGGDLPNQGKGLRR